MKKRIVLGALLVPMLALAQPKTADDWYKEGETQYNLGNFEKAADAFKQGFSLETTDSKKPAYLYNVAQAYRQGNKCKDAAFFYKRYLSLKDQDTAKPLKPEKRAEIEQRINELEECSRTQDSIASRPPDTLEGPGKGKTGKPGGTTTTPTTPTTTTKPPGTPATTTKPPVTPTTTTKPPGTTTGAIGGTTTGGTTTTGTAAKPPGTTTGIAAAGGTGGITTAGTATGGTTKTGPTVGQAGNGETDDCPDEDGDGECDATGESDGAISTSFMVTPRTINARFVGGLSKIAAGEVTTTINSAFALTAGYPVVTQMQGKLIVDAGLTLGFTPLPYRNNITGETHNASLTSVLANGAGTYMVTPKIGVRGDLGLGILSFGGIEEMGNPFTMNAAATTGALAMFALRVAASVDYALTPNISVAVTPIAFSFSPAKEGLVMSSLIHLDFMLGIGYRM